jgi:hypothetical protein
VPAPLLGNATCGAPFHTFDTGKLSSSEAVKQPEPAFRFCHLSRAHDTWRESVGTRWMLIAKHMPSDEAVEQLNNTKSPTGYPVQSPKPAERNRQADHMLRIAIVLAYTCALGNDR